MSDPKEVKIEEKIKNNSTPVEETEVADIELERIAGGKGSEYCVLPTIVI
jgi:hypothetical protein